MARLLPHLSQEAETRLIVAVQQSNDGYPEQLDTLREWHPEITDEDIDTVCEELRQGEQEGREAAHNERQHYDGGYADRETQHGRYIDCGPEAWDDRDGEG